MKSRRRVLIAGESWVTVGLHLKGVSTYTTGGYAVGLKELVKALESCGWHVTHIPNHLATTEFPAKLDALNDFDVVVLSDIPADTLLLHPETFEQGKRTPDRLQLLNDYVNQGRGLVMIGGYMSFSGFEGKARYQATALAESLPVTMLGHDDRIEAPAGIVPEVRGNHPVLRGLPSQWPFFLGYNRVIAKPDAEVLMEARNDPFLLLGRFGSGRSAVFASDCSPHWGSPEFMAWEGYAPFWDQLLRWTAGTG